MSLLKTYFVVLVPGIELLIQPLFCFHNPITQLLRYVPQGSEKKWCFHTALIYTTNFVPKWKTSAWRLAFPHVKLPEQSGLTSSRSCVLLCGCSCLNLSGHVIGLLGGKGAVLCFLPCTAFPSKVAKNTLKNPPRRQTLVESSHKGEPVVNFLPRIRALSYFRKCFQYEVGS